MPPTDRIEGPDDVSTWLVIPYFDGDVGRPGTERPLTAAMAIFYLCPSIIVNGQAGVFTLRRGEPMGVTVDVANWGAGSLTAPAQVRVWWAEPALGFAKAHPFGSAVVLVPPGGVPVRSDTIIGTIPTTAPNHVCLLVSVSAPLDGTGPTAVADPAGDRHWAQANLTEVVADADGAFSVPFMAGNPFDAPVTVTFAVDALTGTEIEAFRRMTERDVRTGQAEAVELSGPDGTAAREVALAPHSQTPLTLRGRLPGGLDAGQDLVLAITCRTPRPGTDAVVSGGLGVRVRGRP